MSVLVRRGDPKVKKFEQISSDHHQMSVAGGVGCWGEGILPCDLSHGTFDYIPHLCEHTHVCENCTFPKLNLQAVIIHNVTNTTVEKY